jgi:hypothetical protein
VTAGEVEIYLRYRYFTGAIVMMVMIVGTFAVELPVKILKKSVSTGKIPVKNP